MTPSTDDSPELHSKAIVSTNSASTHCRQGSTWKPFTMVFMLIISLLVDSFDYEHFADEVSITLIFFFDLAWKLGQEIPSLITFALTMVSIPEEWRWECCVFALGGYQLGSPPSLSNTNRNNVGFGSPGSIFELLNKYLSETIDGVSAFDLWPFLEI